MSQSNLKQVETLQSRFAGYTFFTELPSMKLRLRTKHLRFIYTFDSGHQLVGTVEGDYFPNSPDVVFNLRSLKAICLNPQGNMLMFFDDVFGQIRLLTAEAIFSGSQTDQTSFFSFNSRNAEATVYDGTNDTWVTTGWNPDNWQVDEIGKSKTAMSQSRLQKSTWTNKAIA
jgi:hypothetical protein